MLAEKKLRAIEPALIRRRLFDERGGRRQVTPAHRERCRVRCRSRSLTGAAAARRDENQRERNQIPHVPLSSTSQQQYTAVCGQQT